VLVEFGKFERKSLDSPDFSDIIEFFHKTPLSNLKLVILDLVENRMFEKIFF